MQRVQSVLSGIRKAYGKVRVPAVAWQRGLAGLGLLALLLVAFCCGRCCTHARVEAQVEPLRPSVPLHNSDASDDYQKRIVAYIYKNIPITREELGEYLIARFGVQRVEALVNRKIIDIACRAKGIVVTDIEVETRFKDDMKAIGPNVTAKEFEQHVLRQFNKTLFEWKEDVLRPKIAMERYCQDRVVVTQEDIGNGFEAKYGPKVECRMIVMAANDSQRTEKWEKARHSEEAFSKYAREGTIAVIASQGGKVPPIHKHFGDANVERIAFGLKPGEVSELLQMPDHTWVILKCDRHIGPDTSKKINEERIRLSQQIKDLKVIEAIPKAFQELKLQANPQVFLREQPVLTRPLAQSSR